jgi:hypothetical protein
VNATFNKAPKAREKAAETIALSLGDGELEEPFCLCDLFCPETYHQVLHNGTVFKFDAAGTLTTLYAFDWGVVGGSEAGVTMDKSGNLYGTFPGNNGSDYGNIWQLSPSGKPFPVNSLRRHRHEFMKNLRNNQISQYQKHL